MLPGKATLALWNEPSHDYVGLPITEIIYGPVGLWFSAVGQFLGLKSKISHEQNVNFQFHIRLRNFRLQDSIIIKKISKSVDPLIKYSVPSIFWDSRQETRPQLKLVMVNTNHFSIHYKTALLP